MCDFLHTNIFGWQRPACCSNTLTLPWNALTCHAKQLRMLLDMTTTLEAFAKQFMSNVCMCESGTLVLCYRAASPRPSHANTQIAQSSEKVQQTGACRQNRMVCKAHELPRLHGGCWLISSCKSSQRNQSAVLVVNACSPRTFDVGHKPTKDRIAKVPGAPCTLCSCHTSRNQTA